MEPEPTSLFLKVYGDSPRLKVMDFLITFQEYDYSMKDIAKNSDISYSVIKTFWPLFVQRGIVKLTREVGKAKMYKLNLENPEVQKFIDLYWTTIEKETNKLFEEEREKKPMVVVR